MNNKHSAEFMLRFGAKILPDRPMHPNAKMTGGDLPFWHYYDSQLTQDYWLSCGNNIIYFNDYRSSGGLNRITISGEIK